MSDATQNTENRDARTCVMETRTTEEGLKEFRLSDRPDEVYSSADELRKARGIPDSFGYLLYEGGVEMNGMKPQ